MAGLLDALKQYIRDASPGGLLNPEVPRDMPGEVATGLLGLTPVGDAISGYDAVQSARAGDWTGAGLNALMAVPGIPSVPGIGGAIRRVVDVKKLPDIQDASYPLRDQARYQKELESNRALQKVWAEALSLPLDNPFRNYGTEGVLRQMIDEQRKGMARPAMYRIVD